MIKFFSVLALALIIIIIESGCSEKNRYFEENLDFNKIGFLEKKIIYNREQSNLIEGSYLIVQNVISNEIELNLPDTFLINSSNFKNWHIGWGEDQPYFDAGCENIRLIKNIDFSSNKIKLGNLKRGVGYPEKGQHIVFWNFKSGPYKKHSNKSILDLNKWPEFAGKSVCFGDIVYESSTNNWKIFFQECDTIKRQIFTGESKDLIHWKPSNNSKPNFNYKDFKDINWAKGNFKNKQTPYVTDILFNQDRWVLIFSGLDGDNKNTIGLCTSKSLNGPYEIYSEELIKIGKKGSFNSNGNFCAEITSQNGEFLMAFDGLDDFNNESVGLAYSKDLYNWSLKKGNPVINIHSGWRSKPESSEPDFLSWRNDTITMIVSGTKKLRYKVGEKVVEKNNYKSEPGNVDDAQLGLFISNNNGITFQQHPNNPIIVNNYSDKSENEHMGGNIKWIKFKNKTYFFYQAKTSDGESKYSIYLKIR